MATPRGGARRHVRSAYDDDPSGPRADHVDRRQRVDDQGARGVRAPSRRKDARVICFQELFYGPYFCQVQDAQFYEYAESIPGPTTERFQALAAELGIVMVLPMYEQEQPGVLLQHGRGHRRRRRLPRQVPQDAHPAGEGLLGEVLLPARQPGLPGVRHRGRPRRRLHLLRPALPRRAGARSASTAPRSSSTRRRPRGLSAYLWQLEQPAPAVANEYYIGAINRVGIEDLGDNDFYGTSYFVDPEGNFVGEVGDGNEPELIVRDLDMDLLAEVRNRWAFYRDRRPTRTKGSSNRDRPRPPTT